MAKTEKKKCGRPTVFTDEVVEKLVFAFSMDFNDREASYYAGIDPSTLSRKLSEDVEFFNKMQAFKGETKQKAKIVINSAIVDGDVKTAQWYLEHKASDEYSTKSEQIVKGNHDVNVSDPYAGMSKEEIREVLRGNR
jgi:hypothetical protein